MRSFREKQLRIEKILLENSYILKSRLSENIRTEKEELMYELSRVVKMDKCSQKATVIL